MATSMVTNFKTTLTSGLTSGGSETTINLGSVTTTDGHTLVMADIGDIGFIVIAPGTSSMEICSFTGISGTSLTGVTRGLPFYGTSTSAVSANKKAHGSGEIVIISNNHHWFSEQYVTTDDTQTISGVKTFSVLPVTTAGNPTDDTEFARKAYVDLVGTGLATTNKLIIAGTAGATLAAGNLIYLDTADGEWKLCDADTAASVENILLGIAQGAGTDGNAITSGVLIKGLDSNQTGLTANTKYYASNTAGEISSSAGTKEVTIGFAVSTTSIIFAPRYDQQLTEDQQDALAGSSGTPSTSNKYVTEDDVSAAAASGKIVRATGTALPALSGANLTNLPGTKKAMVAGETINGATLPVPVWFKNSDDEFYACDGNDQAKLEFVGFATSNGTDGNPINIQFNGIVSGFSGLTIGERYWVQDTVGTIGTTRGTYEVSVGIAVSATEILIDKLAEQYIGSQGLSNGGNTITAALQGVWRKIIVVGSGNNGVNTGEVTIYRLGKTSGEHSVSQGSAPSFGVGFSVSWSSTTLTMAGTANSDSATGTAYYFR